MGAPLRAVFANRQVLRVLAAYAGSATAEWALWLAVLVYAYEHGGSTTAGVAAIALLVPSVFVAPWAGRASDGARPNRVLALVYAVQAGALAVTAVLAGLRLPALIVVAVAAVAINAITFIRPAISVVVPGLVVSPADLVAANLLTGNADSVSVLIGPLLASALLVIDGTVLVFGVCAAISLGCAVLIWPVARRETFAVATAPSESNLLAIVRTMARQRGSLELLAVLSAQYALVGGLDLLYVNLAFRTLHLGDAGSGYLSAMFGLGAVLGGIASVMIIARRRLAPVMVVSLAFMSTAMLVLGAWTTLAVTLVVLPVAGLGRTLLDVSGRMLLQRSAPQDVLASVFALLEMLAGLGILCGSVLVQVLVATSGVRAGVVGVGAFLFVVCVLTAAGLRHVDEHADAPVVEVRLLRGVPLFAPLPGPELEVMARGCIAVEFEPGTALIRQGEIGDRYYVIADGHVEVTVDGLVMRTMARGQGFGEIALLAGVPRTATVTALAHTSALVIERSGFLSAVVGHDASARVAWAVARALHGPLAGDGV